MSTVLAPPTSTAAICDELDEGRRRGALQRIVIPPCPELLARLHETMALPEPDLNEVARIASRDVAMAAVLLSQANGPMYAAGQPVQTVGQAMNRLGLERTASVMAGFLVQRAIRVNSPHLQRFWERGTKRGIAMTYLAHKFPGMSPDIAHTFGLFCHVGLPVMMQSVPGYSSTLVEARARKDRTPIETENFNHRTDHAVVGALTARVWRLAPEVMVAIRLHHDLDILDDSHADSDVQSLVATGFLAEHMMLKNEGEEPERGWAEALSRVLTWLDVDASELDVWELELKDLFEAA